MCVHACGWMFVEPGGSVHQASQLELSAGSERKAYATLVTTDHVYGLKIVLNEADQACHFNK